MCEKTAGVEVGDLQGGLTVYGRLWMLADHFRRENSIEMDIVARFLAGQELDPIVAGDEYLCKQTGSNGDSRL